MSKEKVIEIISLIVLKIIQYMNLKILIIIQDIANYLKKKKKNIAKKERHVKIIIKQVILKIIQKNQVQKKNQNLL